MTKKKKSKLIRHIKKHLLTDVALPLVVIVVLFVLIIIKVPYTAKETYKEMEEYTVVVQKFDYDNPQQERVCEEVPAQARYEEDPFSPYPRPYGLNDYRCYAKIKVWNEADNEGKWTLRYIFDIGGKEVVTEVLTKNIPVLNPIEFEFITDECQEGDTITGEYEVVSSPMAEECEYKTVYPKISVTETRKRPVEKERFYKEYEPLWQKLIGYNRHEKV